MECNPQLDLWGQGFLMQQIGIFNEQAVHEVTLQNQRFKTHIITWGAVLREFHVDGRNIVLGFKDFADYPLHSPSFGATCGRVGNRIKVGKVSLNGIDYQLELNQEGAHHRHGGFKGFSKRVWGIEAVGEDFVKLTYNAENGEGGYPANLKVSCTYRLLENGLALEYRAIGDEDTVVNLLHHSYFNLGGEIADHELQVHAINYTPSDENNIPTGEILPVKNTDFDFSKMRKVGETLYDVNLAIEGAGFREAAVLKLGALEMSVISDQKGLQFYDGAKVNTPHHKPRSGLCLEPQAFPDTPNNPQFGSIVLKKGDEYRQNTQFLFNPSSLKGAKPQ